MLQEAGKRSKYVETTGCDLAGADVGRGDVTWHHVCSLSQINKASVRVNLPSEPVLAVAAREGSKSLAYVNGATPS